MAVLVLQNKNIHCTVDFGFYFYFFLFAIDSMPLLIDNDFNQSLIKKWTIILVFIIFNKSIIFKFIFSPMCVHYWIITCSNDWVNKFMWHINPIFFFKYNEWYNSLDWFWLLIYMYIVFLQFQGFALCATMVFAFYAYFYFDHLHFHVTHAYAHLGYPSAQHQVGQRYLHGEKLATFRINCLMVLFFKVSICLIIFHKMYILVASLTIDNIRW